MIMQRAVRRGAFAIALASAAVLPFAAPSDASLVPHVPPATPANVATTAGNKLLAVSWTESSSGTIVFTATAKAPGKANKTCRTKLMACTITALGNGVVWDVTVVATNKSGSSAPSGAVSELVGVPGPPLTVHAIADTAAALVTWAPPKASGVTKVTTYTATASPGGFSCSSSSTVISGLGRACEISGLTSGTSYSVTVTATNSFGTGVPSKAAAVTAS